MKIKDIQPNKRKAIKLSNPGDFFEGVLVEEPKFTQQTDFNTKKPVFWEKSGDPKMQLVLTVQTDEREDAEDDGVRTYYGKSKDFQNKLVAAVELAGVDVIEKGGFVRVDFTHKDTSKGYTEHIYTSAYVPPAKGVAVAAVKAEPTAAPAEAAPATQSPEQEAEELRARLAALNARNSELPEEAPY